MKPITTNLFALQKFPLKKFADISDLKRDKKIVAISRKDKKFSVTHCSPTLRSLYWEQLGTWLAKLKDEVISVSCVSHAPKQSDRDVTQHLIG